VNPETVDRHVGALRRRLGPAGDAVPPALLAALLTLPLSAAACHRAMGSGLALGGMGLLAWVVGAIESTMARLRLVRVPNLLVGATALAVLALVLVVR